MKSALAGVLLGVPLVASQSFGGSEILDGCYYKDQRYLGGRAPEVVAGNYTACQAACQEREGCSYFAWKPPRRCWLLGPEAVITTSWARGMVTGPKHCPEVPSGCTELPGEGFPGRNDEASKRAWPSHRVPEKLECWPQNRTLGQYENCPLVRVLEDTDNGWPGRCAGLQEVPVPDNETCESLCQGDPLCSVYQEVDGGGDVHCLHARLTSSHECYVRKSNPVYKVKAKRIMHGDVRVLANLTGVQVIGLTRVFDENYFINVSQDAVRACMFSCYSNIACQWWQYSLASGCWVEDLTSAAGLVSFPMTTSGWKSRTHFASTIIAGQYIQHFCPGEGGVPGGAPPPPPPPPRPGPTGSPGTPTTTIRPGPRSPGAHPSPRSPPSPPARPRPAPPTSTTGYPDTRVCRPDQAANLTAENAEALDVSMTVSCYDYTSVTPEVQRNLTRAIVGTISATCGINSKQVLNLDGCPAMVSLGSATTGIHSNFFILPSMGGPGRRAQGGPGDVCPGLFGPSFKGAILDEAARALDAEALGFCKPEVQLRLFSVPATAGSTATSTTTQAQDAVGAWLSYAVLAALSLLVLIVVCCLCVGRGRARSGKAHASQAPESKHVTRSARARGEVRAQHAAAHDGGHPQAAELQRPLTQVPEEGWSQMSVEEPGGKQGFDDSSLWGAEASPLMRGAPRPLPAHYREPPSTMSPPGSCSVPMRCARLSGVSSPPSSVQMRSARLSGGPPSLVAPFQPLVPMARSPVSTPGSSVTLRAPPTAGRPWAPLGSALRQAAGLGGTPPNGDRRGMWLFDMLDRNGDGVLTRDEFPL